MAATAEGTLSQDPRAHRRRCWPSPGRGFRSRRGWTLWLSSRASGRSRRVRRRPTAQLAAAPLCKSAAHSTTHYVKFDNLRRQSRRLRTPARSGTSHGAPPRRSAAPRAHSLPAGAAVLLVDVGHQVLTEGQLESTSTCGARAVVATVHDLVGETLAPADRLRPADDAQSTRANAHKTFITTDLLTLTHAIRLMMRRASDFGLSCGAR